MEFDKSRVYTVLNADELKVGSKVIVANTMESLKCKVDDKSDITEVVEIFGENCERRFRTTFTGGWPLAYLISEPEEKKLKWTDFKIGDVIKRKDSEICHLVTGMDYKEDATSHILIDHSWICDDCLCYWEKVEEND